MTIINFDYKKEIEKDEKDLSLRTFPRPTPIIALVGVSISGIPGPPLGPSPLMTTTFP